MREPFLYVLHSPNRCPVKSKSNLIPKLVYTLRMDSEENLTSYMIKGVALEFNPTEENYPGF